MNDNALPDFDANRRANDLVLLSQAKGALLSTQRAPLSTFAQALAPATVSYEHLRKHYNPFLQLALRFLGVMAHCYPYMEIWPTSFRSYNLMLPNLMEFPFSLFGSPSIGLRGLGMYASSRAANCMYCSAHCCAVGIRGGLDEAKLKRAMSPSDVHSPGERALIRVANGMSTLPATLTPDDVHELQKYFKPAEVDGLVLSIVMMGFLNKMMDAMGFNLEEGVTEAVKEVASASGWTAGRHEVVSTGRERYASKGRPWRLWLSMVPYMPAAVRADSRWTKGVPSSAKQATPWLVDRTGYEFPMITAARQGRIIRTMSTMVRDNLDPEVSELGVPAKQLAGVIYSAGLVNDELVRGARVMAQKAVPDASAEFLDRLVELASEPLDLDDPSTLDRVEQELVTAAGDLALNKSQLAAIVLAKAMYPSPAVVPPALVTRSCEYLSPVAIIELVTWLSVLSMLHRYDVYQAAAR